MKFHLQLHNIFIIVMMGKKGKLSSSARRASNESIAGLIPAFNVVEPLDAICIHVDVMKEEYASE